MKKIWIKLVKHYQGGEKIHYKLVNESVINSKYAKDEIMMDWGENSDGGHNYGYKIDMHFLDESELPPVEWFEKEKKTLNNHIEYLKCDIKETKETLKLYQKIFSKK